MGRIFMLCLCVFGFIIAIGVIPVNYTLGNAAQLPMCLLHLVAFVFFGFAILLTYLFVAIYNLGD